MLRSNIISKSNRYRTKSLGLSVFAFVEAKEKTKKLKGKMKEKRKGMKKKSFRATGNEFLSLCQQRIKISEINVYFSFCK